jgi:hypothetical protein
VFHGSFSNLPGRSATAGKRRKHGRRAEEPDPHGSSIIGPLVTIASRHLSAPVAHTPEL